MNPITHGLVSWSVGDAVGLGPRDRVLATWCGVAPDADGLGVVIDGINKLLGRPDTWLFGRYHHAWLHGLPAAIVLPLAIAAVAERRLRTFAAGVLVVHLHLLGDIVGSRGPTAADIWPIRYLAPISERWTIAWSGQWALNAWPNIALTLALLAFAFYRAVRSGYSPVEAFHPRADRAFVDTVRRRWRVWRG